MALALSLGGMVAVNTKCFGQRLTELLNTMIGSWCHMQVGDLVRHEMYSKLKTPALVLWVGALQENGSQMIKIFDPDDGIPTWDSSKDYEVISASR